MTIPKITPVIVTHFSPRPEYGDLSPPSNGIVKTTIESLRDSFPAAQSTLMATPLLIYNQPTDINSSAIAYQKQLRELSKQEDMEMLTVPNKGIGEAMLLALAELSTPYIFFLEHDWRFLTVFNLSQLIQLFERNDEVNYIRFNKSQNRAGGWDTVVKQDNSKSIPLCRTSAFSNNPHIARIEPYQEWVQNSDPSLGIFWHTLQRDSNEVGHSLRDIYRVLKSKYLLRQPQTRGFDTVEFSICTYYRNMIDKIGFDKAHSRMGIYLYGAKGDGPFVEHLGQ